jgi:hypothetical protein
MLSLFFILVAGMLNAIMDLCGFFDQTIFTKIPGMRPFMEEKISWKNKYKNGDVNQGPRFFLSTKVLVFLTDMWHLCKTLMVVLIGLSIVSYTPIFNTNIDFLIYLVSFGISFTFFYDYGFRLKRYWVKPW